MFPRLYQNLRRLLVVSYFVKFGRFAAQMRSDALSWTFVIRHFDHLTCYVCVRFWLLTPNFILMGQYAAEL